MIKINLLIKRPPLVRWRVVLQIGMAFGLLGMVGIGAFTGAASYRKLARELSDTERLLEDYQRVAGRLPAVQKDLGTLQARQSAVAKLGRNQSFSQSAVVRQVRVVPADVRLITLDFTGTDLIISGDSRSFAGAMQYLSYLRSASLLHGVTEQQLTMAENGLVTFTYAARQREGVTEP